MSAWNDLAGEYPWIIYPAVIVLCIVGVAILNKVRGAKYLIGNRIRQMIAEWKNA